MRRGRTGHKLLLGIIAILFMWLNSLPGVYAAGLRSELGIKSSLTVVGNKVLTGNGNVFIPEGISIYGGLESPDYLENTPNVDAQIEAAAQYWHTNTIRLQVSESNLFRHSSPGKIYNANFLSELIREVSLARRLNQVVVINDQTEFTSNQPNPTATTVKFWHVMVATFGNEPYIVFDLFNEPRLGSHNNEVQTRQKRKLDLSVVRKRIMAPHKTSFRRQQLSSQSIWSTWRNGGRVNGTAYVGMQTLINGIRGQGANNLIWAESPYWAQRLPSQQYLLSGSNIEYAYHHINLNSPSSWEAIKNFAASHALVDGEWAQYQSPWAECYEHAPTTTPKYLQLLKESHIGLVAWSLQAGSLLAGSPFVIPANLNSLTDPMQPVQLQAPSKFSTTYSCNNEYGQGAGQLIMRYFKLNSIQL